MMSLKKANIINALYTFQDFVYLLINLTILRNISDDNREQIPKYLIELFLLYCRMHIQSDLKPSSLSEQQNSDLETAINSQKATLTYIRYLAGWNAQYLPYGFH